MELRLYVSLGKLKSWHNSDRNSNHGVHPDWMPSDYRPGKLQLSSMQTFLFLSFFPSGDAKMGRTVVVRPWSKLKRGSFGWLPLALMRGTPMLSLTDLCISS